MWPCDCARYTTALLACTVCLYLHVKYDLPVGRRCPSIPYMLGLKYCHGGYSICQSLRVGGGYKLSYQAKLEGRNWLAPRCRYFTVAGVTTERVTSLGYPPLWPGGDETIYYLHAINLVRSYDPRGLRVIVFYVSSGTSSTYSVHNYEA